MARITSFYDLSLELTCCVDLCAFWQKNVCYGVFSGYDKFNIWNKDKHEETGGNRLSFMHGDRIRFQKTLRSKRRREERTTTAFWAELDRRSGLESKFNLSYLDSDFCTSSQL